MDKKLLTDSSKTRSNNQIDEILLYKIISTNEELIDLLRSN